MTGKVTNIYGSMFDAEGVHYNAIVEVENLRGHSGDSGGPVLTKFGGDNVLVGIYKGKSESVGYFTNFSKIKSAYRVNLVY